MIYEEIKQPLPIYNRLEKQYRFQKPGETINKVIVSKDKLIPFQFKVPPVVSALLTSWTINLPDPNRTLIQDLTPNIPNIEAVELATGEFYFLYKAETLSGVMLAPGEYHLEFVIDGKRYYSEVFEVRCDSPLYDSLENSYTIIEFDNGGCDLGPILYQTGFRFRIYLDTKIAQEAPTIEEDGGNDGDGNFIPARQQYVENLNLEYVTPYYIVEVLTLLALHNYVYLRTPLDLYTGEIRNIKPTSNQEDLKTWLYRIQLSFQQDSKYMNGACCRNMELAAASSVGSGACDAMTQNVELIEQPGGIVGVSWEALGTFDKVQVFWVNNNTTCPQAGLVRLEPDQTGFTLPDPIYLGAIGVFVTPLCGNEVDGFVNGQGASKLIAINSGPSCVTPPDPEPEPEPTAQVIIENNTSDLTITGFNGLTGFTLPYPVGPQSSVSGSHTGGNTGGTINLYFNDANSAFKHARLFVNGVFKQCTYLGGSPASFIITGFDPIPANADVVISINNGDCP